MKHKFEEYDNKIAYTKKLIWQTKYDEFSFRSYSIAEKLPQASVEALAQPIGQKRHFSNPWASAHYIARLHSALGITHHEPFRNTVTALDLVAAMNLGETLSLNFNSDGDSEKGFSESFLNFCALTQV